MEKKTQLRLWIAGLAVTAAASAAAFAYDRPREPLILTYQSEGSAAEETTEKAAPETTARRKKEKQTKTVTTAAETETPSPTETETADTYIEEPERDLNAADAEDLKRVNGIGDALAEAVIAYRDAHGGFRRRAELLEIGGVGEVLQARILAEFYIPDELPPEAAEQPSAGTEPPAAAQGTAPQTEPPAETAPAAVRYDLNKVGKEELMQIPDMTEQLADSILALRERFGEFDNVYELGLIEGIDGRYFEDVLEKYLYIETE